MRTRTVLVVAILLLLVPAAWLAAESAELKDFWDKANYSLGHQIGNDLKRQGTEINTDALAAGISDALSDAPPQLSPDEMQGLLREVKQKLLAEKTAEEAERRQQNQQRKEGYQGEGRDFLEANARKEGVVTLPSGLQYKVIEEGQGRKPGPTDTVTVHYRGTMIDGTEFDSSYSRNEPARFRVDGVIKGWTEALQLMGEGSKWQVFIPPDLAYGERGPLADRTLLFDIDLIAVE